MSVITPRTQGIKESDELAERLQRGWLIIETRSARGEDVTSLEAHWFTLLARYTGAYDREREDR